MDPRYPFYRRAKRELNSGGMVEAVWRRAMARAHGDRDTAELLYVELRNMDLFVDAAETAMAELKREKEEQHERDRWDLIAICFIGGVMFVRTLLSWMAGR